MATTKTYSYSRLTAPDFDDARESCLSTDDAIFTARPTATIPFANVTASYGPRTTGIPYLGTFCDDYPIESQGCTYYAGVTFRYYVPDKTLSMTVATVIVNVTQSQNSTNTASPSTITKAPSATDAELRSYELAELPTINFSPTDGIWQWWGYEFLGLPQTSTVFEQNGDDADITSGQAAKGFVNILNVMATRECQEAQYKTTCHIGGNSMIITVPANDPNFDMRTWSADEQHLVIPGVQSAFEQRWPALSSCSPFVYGFPIPMYVVSTLTDTVYNTNYMEPPPSLPNSNPNQPGNPPPNPGQPAPAAPSQTIIPIQNPPVPAAPGSLSPPPPPTTFSVPLPSTTANVVYQAGASQMTVGSQVVSKNGPAITLAGGATVSWNSAGLVVNDGKVATIPLAAAAAAADPLRPGYTAALGQGQAGTGVVTIGGQTVGYSAGSSGEVVLGSVTLKAGAPAATVSGRVVSLGAGGLVIGGEGVSANGPPTTIPLTTGTKKATPTASGSQAPSTSGTTKKPGLASGGRRRADSPVGSGVLGWRAVIVALLFLNILTL